MKLDLWQKFARRVPGRLSLYQGFLVPPGGALLLTAAERNLFNMGMENNIRYLVVTPGRSGSSLLCAILADAGANFGMPTIAEWPHDEGAFQHPLAANVTRLLPRIELLSNDPWIGWVRRVVKKRLKRRFAAAMSALWTSADYVKIAASHTLVPASVRLGFQPRIILNIREYRACVSSLCRLTAHRRTPDQMREVYRAALYNGLALLHVHGGVVVDFDDLRQNSDWIGPVSHLTGLPYDALFQSWRARVETRESGSTEFADDPELEQLYEQARRLTTPSAITPAPESAFGE